VPVELTPISGNTKLDVNSWAYDLTVSAVLTRYPARLMICRWKIVRPAF
jgi:hypothetical protein